MNDGVVMDELVNENENVEENVTTTVVIDNGELITIGNDCLDELQEIRNELSFEHEYLEYQREQIEVNNSILLAILVFSGACLGALIFRHLRK
jgi:hypothetical protein